VRTDSLKFLQELVEAPSPSGYENPIAQLYQTYVSQFTRHISADVSGNVIAVINPEAKMKIMLAGHMDEIGFIIHYIDDNGLLFFSTIGGHDSVVPVGQRVWVNGRQRVAGVIGRKAIHLLDEAELKRKPDFADLWIDIGATSLGQAETVVSIGDSATFQYGFQSLMGDLVTARAFDNKAGVFIVGETMRLLHLQGGLDKGVGVYAVATVQEEIGSRGAQTAAFDIAPQTGLAVDMGHARDLPGISLEQHGRLDLGKGPGIARGANTNQAVFNLLKNAAEAEGVPYQTTVIPGTSPTDARALQVNRGGMATGLLEVPLRYMHTPCEVLDLTDLESCARLMAAYCRSVRPDTSFTPVTDLVERSLYGTVRTDRS
jgi:putative aminopeptidase FrvX